MEISDARKETTYTKSSLTDSVDDTLRGNVSSRLDRSSDLGPRERLLTVRHGSQLVLNISPRSEDIFPSVGREVETS